MKRFFINFFLFFVSLFIFDKTLALNSDIVINEIGAYPSGDHQWIEIWNKGNEAVDLTGWKFWEGETNHGLKADDPIVSPGEYAVIVDSTSTFLFDYPLFSGSVFDSSFSLNKTTGEEIGLIDVPDSANHANNHYVEKFIYLSASNSSLERRNPFLADYTAANWQERTSSNTVGFKNSNFVDDSVISSTTTTSTPATSTVFFSEEEIAVWSNLKINEFVSDPEFGNEWVEIFNPSTTSLDLANGYICDSRNTTSTCKMIGGIILANGWLKVDLLTGSYLNNSGDAVVLKNPIGSTVDSVIYSDENSPGKGMSLARSVDGEGEWKLTNQITVGAANIINAPVLSQSSGGSGGGIVYSESATTTVIKKTVTAKDSSSKEKRVGLNWKIKYNLRLRQNEENIFDASKTMDPRGGRIEYGWKIGGQFIFGSKINYSFATSGRQEIIVRATSTAGTVDEKKINVIVYPAEETAGSGIIFSEILSKAISDEDEYIKLKNISNHFVNVSNWKLVYKNDVYEIPTSTFLAANDYLIFYKSITGFSLNNSGGQILLLNQDDVLIDEVNYGKAEEGEIYVYDGEKWVWTISTTSAAVFVKKINTNIKKSSVKIFNNISDARGGQKGDQAIVKGVVTALPGTFGGQYFYLIENNVGIQIYQNKKDFPPLEIGDLVQVHGTISEANGIKRINVKSKNNIDVLSIQNAVSSTELNVDDVDENLIGGLVNVVGEITEIKSNFMYVDNGVDEVVVYFKQGAKIDKTKFKEGENVRVQGIFEQTKNGWQIWPRFAGDIKSLGLSKDLAQKNELNSNSSSTEKYLTATAGGVTTLLLGFLARTRGLLALNGVRKFGKILVEIVKKNKT